MRKGGLMRNHVARMAPVCEPGPPNGRMSCRRTGGCPARSRRTALVDSEVLVYLHLIMADTASKTTPTHVRIAWHCTCFNVRRASRAVTEFYDDIMAPSGVKATQFTMLGAVAMMGPASVTRLAEHLALDRTTLTRNLRVLVDQGMVEIGAGDDRRERVVSLSAGGVAALERATPVWREAQDRLIAKFGEERWRRMIEDMNDLGQIAEDLAGR